MSIIKFPLDDIIGTGIVREAEYRDKLSKLDYSPYKDQAVLIPWIHGQELPIWVYLMAVAKLTPVVSVLSFGELCSPVVLNQRARLNIEKTAN